MSRATGKGSLAPHVVRQIKHSAKALKLMVATMQQGDTAAVHDTRVQVRTTGSILRPFLDIPHMKPLQRQLGRLKKWVGKSNRVRDMEAQLELMEELLPKPYPPAVEQHLRQARKTLQQKRAELVGAKSFVRLPRQMKRTAEAAGKCLGRIPQHQLTGRLDKVCDSLLSSLREDCAAEKQTSRQWHVVRLRVKQLRYLVDCYRGFLEPGLQDFSEEAKVAQQKLGRLRDWQNLRKAMVDEPVMADWLASKTELETGLEQEAANAMVFLSNRLAQHA